MEEEDGATGGNGDTLNQELQILVAAEKGKQFFKVSAGKASAMNPHVFWIERSEGKEERRKEEGRK